MELILEYKNVLLTWEGYRHFSAGFWHTSMLYEKGRICLPCLKGNPFELDLGNIENSVNSRIQMLCAPLFSSGIVYEL